MEEKRDHARHEVFAGNAEITTVVGMGTRPRGRARIIDWSRSGLLLRVPSPRRRFVFMNQAPCLQRFDAVACTLRLPPHYKDMAVHMCVVRVDRLTKEPDTLSVGLKFDVDSTPPETLRALASLLEPRQRSKYSSRMGAISGRTKSTSQRSKSTSQRSKRLPEGSKPLSSETPSAADESQRQAGRKHSQRVAADSKRSKRVPASSQRAAAGSKRSKRVAASSQRVTASSQRAAAGSKRSQRVAAGSKRSQRVAAGSKRISGRSRPPE